MSSLPKRLVVQVYRRTPSRLRIGLVRLLTPNYTAGVVSLLVRENGDVLFLRMTYRKGWGLPGGLLGRKEMPQFAAQRELAEELGIEVGVPPPYRASAHPKHHMVTFFTIVPVSDEQVAAMKTDPVEIAGTQWFPISAMPELDREIAPLEEVDKEAVRSLIARREGRSTD